MYTTVAQFSKKLKLSTWHWIFTTIPFIILSFKIILNQLNLTDTVIFEYIKLKVKI